VISLLMLTFLVLAS